jgi:transglutaminase-like putative cysteine protease
VGWRLLIRHLTVVGYHGPARASYNEVRMTPVALPGQVVLETGLWTDMQVPVWTYRDYWGSHVSAFDIQAPHEELQITSRATVETSEPGPPRDPLDWPELTSRATGGRLLEYLMPTQRTAVSADLAEAARRRVAGLDPLAAAAEISAWVHQHVTYMPGSTGVQTGAQEAWEKCEGVCQDIAHLTVALLRATGLPARYVSGYLFPKPDAVPGEEVTGQSHAWVEYWTGEWAACDPTNDTGVGKRHVVVAAGRDYADVPPLKGIYHGAPSRTMEVTVALTRLA